MRAALVLALVCLLLLVNLAGVSTKRLLSWKLVSQKFDADKVLYAIGDSHGDMNYLVRSLLATQRFMLDQDEIIQWKPPEASDKFEIVILGDFIDRGVFSRENAQLLKRLEDEQPTHLVVLMGNHESMMLRYRTKHADNRGWSNGWTRDDREENLTDSDGEGFELITWLRTRPVVHLTNGALMMHGGLSEPIASKIVQDLASKGCAMRGGTCGKAAMKFINEQARDFYEKLHQCYLSGEDDSVYDVQPEDCDDVITAPYVLASIKKFVPGWSKEKKGGGGVLWYRGFSKLDYGAGTAESCGDARTVAEMFDVDMMMVAHTTHETITKYCGDSLPVFAVDTHYEDCDDNDECDFDVSHWFHEGEGIDFSAENVPQTLVIERGRDGSFKSKKCYSQLKSGKDQEEEEEESDESEESEESEDREDRALAGTGLDNESDSESGGQGEEVQIVVECTGFARLVDVQT